MGERLLRVGCSSDPLARLEQPVDPRPVPAPNRRDSNERELTDEGHTYPRRRRHLCRQQALLLGGGWSITQAGTPFAIAGKIEVPWNQGAEQHSFRLELLDPDGHLVCVSKDDSDEGEPILLDQTFSTGIPAGLKPGTPVDGTFAFSFPTGLPLARGRYEWRLIIDERTEDDWYLAFNVRHVPLDALAA